MLTIHQMGKQEHTYNMNQSTSWMPKFDTQFPADCLEFCPHSELTDIFVCGTYKLDEDQPSQLESSPPGVQHRRGQCLLFSVDKPSSGDGTELHRLQAIDLPAVPDMKWSHRSEASPATLGVADSEGNITLYEWRETERALGRVGALACAPSDTLCLSLDWNNRRAPATGLGSLIVSLSSGSLCLLDVVEGAGLSTTSSWHAHDYEPWIAAWDYWDTNVIYSGGDDLKLKSWDIRQGFEQPVFVNKRFNAGVTTVQCHPHVEHLIAVGSYDNAVQLFDTRKPLVALIQADVGGGAWRVKWHPSASRKHDLLVACMHDGFKVIRFDQDDHASGGDIVKRFDEHQSLAYGADWSYASVGDEETLVASCSFYDHALHVWSG